MKDHHFSDYLAFTSDPFVVNMRYHLLFKFYVRIEIKCSPVLGAVRSVFRVVVVTQK